MQRLVSKVRSAVDKYGLIDENDKIAVGVSGGKDSVVLLCALSKLRRFYPKKFDITAITLDPCFDSKGADYSQIEQLCEKLQVEYKIKRANLFDIIFNDRKEKNPCSLCSRMRRGILHDMCKELNCNKIALGHHLDDAVETFFMNLLIGGNIGCFSPISYLSRKDLYLIRPLVFCEEKEINSVSIKYKLPIEKSKCPADGKTKRQSTKELIKSLEKDYPDIKYKVIGAMKRSNIDGFAENTYNR